MPQTLLLRLPEPGSDETEWLALDEMNAPTLTRQRGSLSLAAAVFRSGRLLVLAPAAQVLLSEPELPPGTGAKIARAVPFALEEQLTEDIDQLVFAIGKRRESGGTPVAVVAKSVIEGWLSELRAAGLEPNAIYTDISLIPENPGQTVLWLENARVAVRRPGSLPFVVELSPIKEALIVAGVIADPLAAADAESAAKVPENALLYVTREDWAAHEAEIKALVDEFASLKVQLLPDGPLPWLARNLSDGDAVNLLQGDYARGTDYGARWRQWRTAAVLAVALLLVHLGAQALQIRQAKKDGAALDTQISDLFNSAAPGEPMRDARRQLQARLDRLRHSGAGPEYFLRTLSALVDATSATPKSNIESMSFHEQTLDLRLTAPDLGSVSQVAQVIGKQGFSADIQSSTPVSNGVEAHMQIHPPK
ncbi:MAG TPA: type II secretion system protein GspL [Steroidobacteraceae bacterium]|jgi:general secretion pathway protein L